MRCNVLFVIIPFFYWRKGYCMKIETHIDSRDYYLNEVNRICNIKQQIFYMNNGVYPIDIYTSIDGINDRQIIVMIFEREKTRELYKRWCNYDTDS